LPGIKIFAWYITHNRGLLRRLMTLSGETILRIVEVASPIRWRVKRGAPGHPHADNGNSVGNVSRAECSRKRYPVLNVGGPGHRPLRLVRRGGPVALARVCILIPIFFNFYYDILSSSLLLGCDITGGLNEIENVRLTT
jgi:hypothetical protein